MFFLLGRHVKSISLISPGFSSLFTNEEGGRKNVEVTFAFVLTRVDEQQNERIPGEEDNSITELTWRESTF